MIDFERQGQKGSVAWQQAYNIFQNASTKVRGLDKSIKDLDSSLGLSNRNVGNYTSAFGKLGAVIPGLIAGFGVAGGIQMFDSVVKNAFNTIKEFDSAQSELASILETNKTGIAEITDLTLKLGATTAFTSTQATKAATELAKLGFSQNEIGQSLEGIINGSLALGSEIPETAELVAATLKAFNLDAKDTNRVVSTLAAGANATSLGFESLRTSLGNVAPAASAANYTVEQTVALLGLITDNGIDASTAGTSLRNMFIQLSAKGITLDEALNQIANSQNKLTKATEIFDVRSAVSALALANQKDRVEGLTKALTGQESVLDEMVNVRMDNLEGSLKLLNSAWEGFILSIEKGDGVLAKMTRGIIDSTTSLLNLITPTREYSDNLLEQQVNMNLLAAEYMSLNEKDSKRVATLEKLKSTYPELLTYLNQEVVTNKDLSEALILVNSQYASKIAIAKGNEKVTKSIEEEAEKTAALGNAAKNLIAHIQGIQNSNPKIKFEIDYSHLQKSASDFAKYLESVGGVENKVQAEAVRELRDQYAEATRILNIYKRSTLEAQKESNELSQYHISQQANVLALSINYDKAERVLEEYKKGIISQGDAYLKLTGNQKASQEELIAFENLINNFSKGTLNTLINQIAKEELSVNSNRKGILDLSLSYAEAINITERYSNLFPESIRNTDNYKKSIENLTLSQIKEKTELIERINKIKSNISINDLMMSSISALTVKWNNLNGAINDTNFNFDLNTENGINGAINQLKNYRADKIIFSKEYIEISKIIENLQKKLDDARGINNKKTQTSIKKTVKDSNTLYSNRAKAMQEDLEYYIQSNKLKNKSEEESLEILNNIQQKKQNILSYQRSHNLISEAKYQTELIKLLEESNKSQIDYLKKSVQEKVDLLTAQYNLKQIPVSKLIETERIASEERKNILTQEFENGVLSRQEYETAILKEVKSFNDKLKGLNDEEADRQFKGADLILKNFQATNRSKFEEANILNNTLFNQEVERVKKELELQQNALKAKYSINEQELNDRVKLGKKLTENEANYLLEIQKLNQDTSNYIKDSYEKTIGGILNDLENKREGNSDKIPLIERVLFGEGGSETFQEIQPKIDELTKAIEILGSTGGNEEDIEAKKKQREDLLKLMEEERWKEIELMGLRKAATLESLEDGKALIKQIIQMAVAEAILNAVKEAKIPFPAKIAVVASAGIAINSLLNSMLNSISFEKGTPNAPFTGIARVDEKGPEIHTDKHGYIKSLGKKEGARFTHIEKGDKIFTASQSKRMRAVLNKPNTYSHLNFDSQPLVINANGGQIDYKRLGNEFVSALEKQGNKKENKYYLNGSDGIIEIIEKKGFRKIIVHKEELYKDK